MTVIYGSELSKKIKAALAKEIEGYKSQGRRLPGLAVILVGEDPASQSYVRSKANGCKEIGIENTTILLDENISQDELEGVIEELNANPEVDGILVQLPLPKHLDEKKALAHIDADKDVDGLTVENAGALLTGQEGMIPCTPKGVMKMLEEAGYDDLSGLKAVVFGRSNLVGKPLALLLQNKNATVTTLHSKSPDAQKISKEADIVVAAIGRPKYVNADFIKEGAAVIDVGINRVDGKLVGDVDFESVEPVASVITPVPKGVGPMTVCMLLDNTVESYRKREHIA